MAQILIGIGFFGMIIFSIIAVQNGTIPNKHAIANITTTTIVNSSFVCVNRSVLAYAIDGNPSISRHVMVDTYNDAFPCPIGVSSTDTINICYCQWDPQLYESYPCRGSNTIAITFLVLSIFSALVMFLTFVYHTLYPLQIVSQQRSTILGNPKKNNIEIHTIEVHEYPHMAKSKSSSVLVVNP
jgi:hypothetical protein